MSGNQTEIAGANLALLDKELDDIKFIFESRFGIECTAHLRRDTQRGPLGLRNIDTFNTISIVKLKQPFARIIG